MAVFNTEVFKVRDAAGFKKAIETLKPSLLAEGASDVRLFTQVGDEKTFIVTSWWTTAEACRAFAQNHENEFMTLLMPQVDDAEPEYLWQQV